MEKSEYLIKTFSRTKRKDYENYILNALWQKIDCLNIRPVTQQYVKGNNNEYYLIDLYFPQINVGVEVDEAFHKNNQELDKQREITMEKKLSSIREEELFEIKRIDATLPLEELTKRIVDVAGEIKQKIVEKKIIQWDTDISISEQVKEKGFIDINDYYRFRLITEITNQLFFKNYAGYQRGGIDVIINDKPAVVWFPQISSKEKAEHNLWLNYLNDDWSVITENNIREDGKTISHELGQPRVVFAKITDNFGKRNYRYIGNFRLKEFSKDDKLRIYGKVSDRLYIDFEKEILEIR